MGRDGTEVTGHTATKREVLVAAIQLSTYQFKRNSQALLIVNNLWLMGRKAHVLCSTISLVVHDKGELRRNHRLNGLCQRVIAKHVTLHEIGHLQIGRRIYG